MLTSLLPGVRDVKAPLAAGALLLASCYVVLHDQVTRLDRPGRLSDGVQSLVDRIGGRGWLALGAVVAYLVGAAYMSLHRSVLRQVAAGMTATVTSSPYLYERRQARWESVMAPFSRPSMRRVGLLRSEAHDEGLAHAVAIDIIFGGGKRLLVANPDLHGEYDRLVSEAEFRDAVLLPSFLLLGVVLANVDASLSMEAVTTVVVALLGVVLFAQARALDREARSMYAHAVADGVVSTAALDQVDGSTTRTGPRPAPAEARAAD